MNSIIFNSFYHVKVLSYYKEVIKNLKCSVYFSSPYCSWQCDLNKMKMVYYDSICQKPSKSEVEVVMIKLIKWQ